MNLFSVGVVNNKTVEKYSIPWSSNYFSSSTILNKLLIALAMPNNLLCLYLFEKLHFQRCFDFVLTIFSKYHFYPTALKGGRGIVFTHGVRIDGRVGVGKSLSGLYLRNCKV